MTEAPREAHMPDSPYRNDQWNARRNRLIFRSRHRGTQECDLLLGEFVDRRLAGLDAGQLRRFEALLDCSDLDLFDWILGGRMPPAEHDHDVLQMLRDYWAQRQHSALERSQKDIQTGE